MGLTSSRWITIGKTLARRRRAQPASCRCRVAVERAADRYTLICDGPVSLAAGAALRAVERDRVGGLQPRLVGELIVRLALGG
jgi:hypothetical protein